MDCVQDLRQRHRATVEDFDFATEEDMPVVIARGPGTRKAPPLVFCQTSEVHAPTAARGPRLRWVEGAEAYAAEWLAGVISDVDRDLRAGNGTGKYVSRDRF
jgi:hypothetical protein